MQVVSGVVGRAIFTAVPRQVSLIDPVRAAMLDAELARLETENADLLRRGDPDPARREAVRREMIALRHREELARSEWRVAGERAVQRGGVGELALDVGVALLAPRRHRAGGERGRVAATAGDLGVRADAPERHRGAVAGVERAGREDRAAGRGIGRRRAERRDEGEGEAQPGEERALHGDLPGEGTVPERGHDVRRREHPERGAHRDVQVPPEAERAPPEFGAAGDPPFRARSSPG